MRLLCDIGAQLEFSLGDRRTVSADLPTYLAILQFWGRLRLGRRCVASEFFRRGRPPGLMLGVESLLNQIIRSEVTKTSVALATLRANKLRSFLTGFGFSSASLP